jgi:DNA-binding response OmpR family regulator
MECDHSECRLTRRDAGRAGLQPAAELSASYDLLILDLMLPEIGGEQLLGFLEKTQPKSPAGDRDHRFPGPAEL